MAKVTLEDVKEVLVKDLNRISEEWKQEGNEEEATRHDKEKGKVEKAKDMNEVREVFAYDFNNEDEVDSWILMLLMQLTQSKE